MHRTRLVPAAAALLLVLAACTSVTETSSSPEPIPTPTEEPSATPTERASPTVEPSESAPAEPTPSATPAGGEPGGFTFTSNAEADSLFLDRFSCQNLDGGFEVDFPAEWNANAEVGGVPPCSWFAATEYEATGSLDDPPDEVAIEIRISDVDLLLVDAEVSDRAEGFIGVTQSAYRVMVSTQDITHYYYVVQLGRSFEEGPNLIAYTDTTMGGDFDLNRAVLDRMMATMEFIGVIQ